MSSAASPRPTLAERLPPAPLRDPDEILGRFLGWVEAVGLTPYPEQEEAILELVQDHHVVLATPTGSGKSLVAEALHFKGLCEGRRSFYTAPTKALVSEKFFVLCEDFGAERVGMLTGDASINRDAPVICCTTEVLANMALREGPSLDAPYAILDEFHYYGDRDRGVSWQVPLLTLPRTLFLLMSATLGNTRPLASRLQEATGREVAEIHSDTRPVPLDFDYRETALHETIESLLAENKAPIYVVSFTQRECAERAQALTSVNVVGREGKQALQKALAGARFDSPYGRELSRFLRHGVGVHHAGLLPKYRLLVEQLAQQGLLRVICGTDTLGVGVNIPIRTVVLTQLCKFDGEKVSILSVREFRQIAGRAGRKGFDEQGSVVVQAPEHVTANKKLAAKAAESGRRKAVRKKSPRRGLVPWSRDTFDRLVASPPEVLESRFDVTHGMLVNVLQRDDGDPSGGYRILANVVSRSHESDARKARHRRRAAQLVRSLRRAGLVRRVFDPEAGAPRLRVSGELQLDFSLHHALSLYLIEALAALDPESPAYAVDLLGLVEAILEDPRAILYAQEKRAKTALLAELKAEGVPFEDRIARLEEVSWPRPQEEFVRTTFGLFADRHPWVGEEDIHPKSVAREMFETGVSFDDYVRQLGVARSEGLLLRYLSQVHNTLVTNVPAAAKTDAVIDAIAYLRTEVQNVDASLIEAWRALLVPAAPADEPAAGAKPPPFDLASEPRALAARVRAELHALVRALSRGAYEEAERAVRQDPEDPWDAARFADALAPFLAEYERLEFTPDARQAHRTRLRRAGARTFDVSQVLVDPAGDGFWCVEGEVDLTRERDPEGPLVRVRRIGT